MKKLLLILSFTALPLVVSAQEPQTETKIWVERYQKSDEDAMKMAIESRKEINNNLDKTLSDMNDGQKATMANMMRKAEKKKAKLSGNANDTIEIKGNDDKAIKKYVNDSFNTDAYVPLSKPELIQVDIDSLE